MAIFDKKSKGQAPDPNERPGPDLEAQLAELAAHIDELQAEYDRRLSALEGHVRLMTALLAQLDSRVIDSNLAAAHAAVVALHAEFTGAAAKSAEEKALAERDERFARLGQQIEAEGKTVQNVK